MLRQGHPDISLRQASPFRLTKQLMPTPRGSLHLVCAGLKIPCETLVQTPPSLNVRGRKNCWLAMGDLFGVAG